MNYGFMIKIIYEQYLNLLLILLCMMCYLCKSLRIISLVWPTRLIFLAMGEVLSFGFNPALLDPSDKRGNDTCCIVAIKDKKMGLMTHKYRGSIVVLSISKS